MAFTSEIEKLERRWNENPLGLTFAPYAEACRKAGDFAKALDLLEKGLAQHPNYVPAHIVRGRCHLDIQADADAEQAFLRAVELDPENVIALKSLAELSERAGRLPDAIRRLEQLLEVDRNNEEARNQLDRVLELQAAPPAVPTPSEGSAPDELATEEAPQGRPVRASNTGEEIESYGEPALIDLVPFEPEHASSGGRNEWAVSNDSEAIRATEAPMGDIVLGADPPDYPPGFSAEAPPELAADEAPLTPLVTEIDQPIVDVLPPPPAAEAEAETILPPAPPAPEPVEEMALEPEPEREVEPVPGLEPEAEPLWKPEAEPVASPAPAAELGETPEMEPESAAAPAAEPEPVPVSEVDSIHESLVAAPEPELVVTASMAEVFLRQGYRELARAVYLQLAERDPSDIRIASALAALQPEPAPPPPPPAPLPEPHFDATSTGGRSIQQLFLTILSAGRPASAATVHPPAFEPPRRPTGEPTRPAQESLSLSAVFGEEAAPSAPTGGTAPAADGEPSFDEFYTAQGGASEEPGAPSGPATAPPADSATAPEDLEQFNAWLRGLKR
jgi:tetratricopeptide (TPR) repeat protein